MNIPSATETPSLCTAADSTQSRTSGFPSKSLARFASVLFGAFLMSGCGALISPPGPEGEPDPAPFACMDNSECGADQYCDTINYCETDPACDEDGACDAVCFGRCIDEQIRTGCYDDSECGAGQHCDFGQGGGGELPPDAPNGIMMMEGQCVDDVAPPSGCYSTSDCATGDICDTNNYCDAPPGCEEGMDCPAVCYGRCVAPNTGCFSDADCDEDEFCRYSNGTSPGAPGALVAEQGVCVYQDCGSEDIALPTCPPNTIPVSVGGDRCGDVICQPIDDCSGLDPESCAQNPQCQTETVPVICACAEPAPGDEQADPAPCLCDDVESETICVPSRTCEGLDPYQCDQNPECEGYYYDEGFDCDPNSGENCAAPAPGFICTERPQREGCRDSRDCGSDQQCEIFTVCTDGCLVDPTGTEGDCLSECWEVGECVYSERNCYDLQEWECEEDPRCQLSEWGSSTQPAPPPCPEDDPTCAEERPVAPPQCEPRPNPSCLSDDECGVGQYCELEEWCPPCAGDAGDPEFPCFAPCWVEGVCVDGREPPRYCDDENICAPNEECQMVEVCEGGCGVSPAPGGDGVPPEDCAVACYEEALCVPVEVPELCFFDGDCGLGFECIIDYDLCGVPGALIACGGTCEPTSADDDYCLENSDCRDGQRCASELEICYVPPGGPFDVCYSLCVDDVVVEPPANICLEDADCADSERCATEQDICLCDPNDSSCSICYSSCVTRDEEPVCPDVIAYAMNPESRECEQFATPCDVPEGWEACDASTAP